LLALLLAGCAGSREETAPDLDATADRLAREFIIVDTHVDLPYRLHDEFQDVTGSTPDGDFDYPRARAGGLDAPFMSIYVPAGLEEEGGSKELADELIDMVEGIAEGAPDKFVVAHTPGDVRAAHTNGLVALPMGMENGSPVEGDLANLAHFHERGIRYITLAHSRNNEICDSSYDEERKWNGLSPFGREVVAEMNRLGIMIDVSHISDDSFWHVIETTEAPVIASHSNCRKFTPGWERNMDDDMIRALGENGGVIQINFGSMFLRGDAQKQSDKAWSDFRQFNDEHGTSWRDEEARAFREQYWKDNPRIYATLDDVVAQIDHVVSLVGIDHVGLGSDFDGVGDSLPEGLKDVSGYPNLIRALLEAGYAEDDVRKICGENLLRVWTEVEDVAARLQQERG
jgi:membrane dipeptidase